MGLDWGVRTRDYFQAGAQPVYPLILTCRPRNKTSSYSRQVNVTVENYSSNDKICMGRCGPFYAWHPGVQERRASVLVQNPGASSKNQRTCAAKMAFWKRNSPRAMPHKQMAPCATALRMQPATNRLICGCIPATWLSST